MACGNPLCCGVGKGRGVGVWAKRGEWVRRQRPRYDAAVIHSRRHLIPPLGGAGLGTAIHACVLLAVVTLLSHFQPVSASERAAWMGSTESCRGVRQLVEEAHSPGAMARPRSLTENTGPSPGNGKVYAVLLAAPMGAPPYSADGAPCPDAPATPECRAGRRPSGPRGPPYRASPGVFPAGFSPGFSPIDNERS